jgi:hypothetical protein
MNGLPGVETGRGRGVTALLWIQVKSLCGDTEKGWRTRGLWSSAGRKCPVARSLGNQGFCRGVTQDDVEASGRTQAVTHTRCFGTCTDAVSTLRKRVWDGFGWTLSLGSLGTDGPKTVGKTLPDLTLIFEEDDQSTPQTVQAITSTSTSCGPIPQPAPKLAPPPPQHHFHRGSPGSPARPRVSHAQTPPRAPTGA